MALLVTEADCARLMSQAGGWVLVFARVLGLCLTAPALAADALGWRFRIGIAAALAVVLVPMADNSFASTTDCSSAGWAGISELLTGGLLGWSAALIVAGARLAGDLVCAQAGLCSAALFASGVGEELTPFGRLYEWLAVALYLMMDGPFLMLCALVESYGPIPSGRLLMLQDSAGLAFGEVTHALGLALRVAAPAGLASFFSNIVVSWINRAFRPFPFLALALSVRGLLGIAFALLCLSALAVTLAGAWATLLSR
jgi:flagellar biosynthetic protein FliR